MSGDAERVAELVYAGADVSYFDGEGLTPLMHAARHGYAVIVEALLHAGAPWNALSPSELSAGDFAMKNRHQEAFNLLLDAGLIAELVLGTIAKRIKKMIMLLKNTWEDMVVFSEDRLTDSNSKAIMMAWEKPLMEAHRKAICRTYNGHILNIGFGMGIVDNAIQQYTPCKHTSIEGQPKVYDRMIQSGWGEKENVRILFGRWDFL